MKRPPRPAAAAIAEPPVSDPCDFLTYIFHGLALVHGTTQELCRSTATVWFLYHRPLLASDDFQGPRGLKQKRKLSPGPDTSGRKPDPVARARHTYGPAPPVRAGPSRSEHRSRNYYRVPFRHCIPRSLYVRICFLLGQTAAVAVPAATSSSRPQQPLLSHHHTPRATTVGKGTLCQGDEARLRHLGDQ